jgi:rhodanese-related sulfurtransferase
MNTVQQLILQNALIIDVRSREEFNSAAYPNSINIPLDEIITAIGKIDKSRPIILCCASGMRSKMAKNILKQNGIINTHDIGSWKNIPMCKN